MEYKTKDGYTIRAFSSMYVDFGLEILDQNGDQAAYTPCALSSDSYGSTNGRAWSDARWRKQLAAEAGDLVEAFVPQCTGCDKFVACEWVNTGDNMQPLCKECK